VPRGEWSNDGEWHLGKLWRMKIIDGEVGSLHWFVVLIVPLVERLILVIGLRCSLYHWWRVDVSTLYREFMCVEACKYALVGGVQWLLWLFKTKKIYILRCMPRIVNWKTHLESRYEWCLVGLFCIIIYNHFKKSYKVSNDIVCLFHEVVLKCFIIIIIMCYSQESLN